MSSEDQNTERKADRDAFERWFVATQTTKNHGRIAKYPETGVYIDRVVRIAWRAWRTGFAQAHRQDSDSPAVRGVEGH